MDIAGYKPRWGGIVCATARSAPQGDGEDRQVSLGESGDAARLAERAWPDAGEELTPLDRDVRQLGVIQVVRDRDLVHLLQMRDLACLLGEVPLGSQVGSRRWGQVLQSNIEWCMIGL